MKILILGSGGQCRSIISILESSNQYKIIGIIDISYNGQNESIMGYNVIGGLDELKKFYGYNIVVALGNNSDREKLVSEIQIENFVFPNIYHKKSFKDKISKCGMGNIMGCFSYLGPQTKIGDFNILNTNSVIEHEVKIGSFNHIAPSATLCGKVNLDDSILIGANAVVLPRINISKGAIVGAGSTLINNVSKEFSVNAGSPAVKI